MTSRQQYWCATCEEFLGAGSSPHACPPAWDVRLAEDDDWMVVYARDADDAAEKAAAKAWSNSAGEIGTGPHDVVVRKDGVEHKFAVSGEYDISWSAHEARR